MGGKRFKKSQEVDWVSLDLDEDRIKTLFYNKFLYHNPELEVEAKVGDRLEEMDFEQLKVLYRLMNAIIQDKTTTKEEYNKKKIKWSVVETKLRAFIRKFVYNNKWIQDQFEAERDKILGD